MPTGNLPAEAKKIWEKVYNEAKNAGDSEEKAAKKAWGSVKNAGWSKDEDGKWHKKSQITHLSMRFDKASYDKKTNEMRWSAIASDTDEDLANDNMELELFEDFVSRIENGELVPEEFRSDFWSGGMPYISVSHYPDLNGDAVPGTIERVYIDGNCLKAKGTFNDTPLGNACFKAVNSDLYGDGQERDDKVRISIGFLDWKHEHKSNNFEFTRENIYDWCPECFMEFLSMFDDESEPPAGKKFKSGHLIHLAMTRIPMNERTLMEVDRSMTTKLEDAKSIIGDELAEEIDEKAHEELVGKSAALVIKADEEPEMIEETKSEIEELPVEEEKSDTETDSIVTAPPEATPEVTVETRSEIEEHPLDKFFGIFKENFDVVSETDASSEEKLRMLQESFNQLGEVVKNLIENSVTDNAQQESNEISVLAEAVKALNEKVDGITRLLSSQEKPTVPASPPRRSIQLTPDQRREIEQSRTVVKSKTPKLREIIERNT